MWRGQHVHIRPVGSRDWLASPPWLCGQVWDFEKGRVRMDLPYQARDDFMMHDESVLALGFARDSEVLASGSRVCKASAPC